MTFDDAFEFFESKGVAKVEIHYYGGGDEGFIDMYVFRDRQAYELRPEYEDSEQAQQIENVLDRSVYDALGEGFGDGEPDIDGYVYWHVMERNITIQHSYQEWKQEDETELWPNNEFGRGG